MKLVAIALPTPLHRLFDYAVRSEDEALLRPGVRVRVPFGRREQVGVVVEAPREEAAPAFPASEYKYKPIAMVLDEEPLIDAELLSLCRWAADYYLHPLGEVLAAALPGPLSRGGLAPPANANAKAQRLRLTSAGAAGIAFLHKRSDEMRALVERLAERAAAAQHAAGRCAEVRAGDPPRAGAELDRDDRRGSRASRRDRDTAGADRHAGPGLVCARQRILRRAAGRRDRQRQDRDLSAPDRAGPGARQASPGAGSGDRAHPAARRALRAPLRRARGQLPLGTERGRARPRLAARPRRRGGRGGGHAIRDLRAAGVAGADPG